VAMPQRVDTVVISADGTRAYFLSTDLSTSITAIDTGGVERVVPRTAQACSRFKIRSSTTLRAASPASDRSLEPYRVRHPRTVSCQAASVSGSVWRCAQALCSL
jgi:hypothetical protein